MGCYGRSQDASRDGLRILGTFVNPSQDLRGRLARKSERPRKFVRKLRGMDGDAMLLESTSRIRSQPKRRCLLATPTHGTMDGGRPLRLCQAAMERGFFDCTPDSVSVIRLVRGQSPS